MFTGIVEGKATISHLADGELCLTELPFPLGEMHLGQSLAVDGCCLTVARKSNSELSFDISPETLSRTTLEERHAGDPVNLERGVALGHHLDGHLVTGHIDGVGRIRQLEKVDLESWLMWMDVPSTHLHWLVEKGSVALDGISLTVNDLDEKGFSVMLIPHTMKITTLGQRQAGDAVNLEFDLIAKYVERMLAPRLAEIRA